MILKIGIPDYPFTCLHEIAGASLKGRKVGKDVPVTLITHDDMKAAHEKWPNMRGCPTKVAFDFKKQRIWLHPTPDGEYDLIVDLGERKEPPKEIVGTITKAALKGHGA